MNHVSRQSMEQVGGGFFFGNAANVLIGIGVLLGIWQVVYPIPAHPAQPDEKPEGSEQSQG